MISAVPSVAQLLVSQLAAFLAVLLAASAIHKLLKFRHARAVVHDFARVPEAAAGAAAALAGGAELLAAAALSVPAYRAAGAALAASLLGVYLALILRAILQGRRDADCGCSFGRSRRPLGAFDAGRNAVLTALALGVALASARAAAPIAASQALGAVTLLALYTALDEVMGLQPMRKGAAL